MWYPMSFIGEGHGENIEAARRDELMATVKGHLAEILPANIMLITVVGYVYNEECGPDYHESVNRLKFDDIVTMIFDDVSNEDNNERNGRDRWTSGLYTLPMLMSCKNYKDVMKLMEGMLEQRDVVRSSVFTPKQYKKQKDAAEFKVCEGIAQTFAADNNVKVGTIEFLTALDKAVNRVEDRREDYNSGERQMEEWADHYHSGAASSYYDNRNYTNSEFRGQLDDLARCYRYIEKEFPLLMMQYKEAKLRRKAARKAKREAK